jgi:hypothetical protein
MYGNAGRATSLILWIMVNLSPERNGSHSPKNHPKARIYLVDSFKIPTGKLFSNLG